MTRKTLTFSGFSSCFDFSRLCKKDAIVSLNLSKKYMSFSILHCLITELNNVLRDFDLHSKHWVLNVLYFTHAFIP